jgi:hypothetical protein
MAARSIALFFLFLISTLATAANAEAKGWRGIVPLHTSRAEVEKLLGPPTERQSDYSVLYRTETETVIINYARGLPCGIGEKYSQWRVPRETVESIYITPNRGSPLSRLNIDESTYKKSSGGHRPEDIYYVNEQVGESLTVFMGEVTSITYSPAASDEGLRCVNLAGSSAKKCEGIAAGDFDAYGEISMANEKRRLDNFVIALMKQKGSEAFIVAYAGKRSPVGEASRRAQRARSYLIKVRKFPVGQLKVIDGGYRERPETELYIVPPGGCPPIARPTLNPTDVRILRAGRRRKPRRL